MSATVRILVAEDEDRLRRLIGMLLNDPQYAVTLAENGAQALEHFSAGPFDLVITDIRMPEMDGMALLESIRQRSPETPVIVITAFGSVENAVEAMRAGAVDYVTKPFEADKFKLAIERALTIRRILDENRNLRRDMRDRYNLENIIADSPAMKRVLATVRQVAASQATVLVTGESGTGKELVTRAIHELSPRSHGPFVAINCAAIPENLLESELFGHERGSFTGATDKRAGKFELASGGTLFLDEIAEMNPAIQAKVLRAIETQEIERVGGSKTIRTDIRFIAATNKDLHAAVREGEFREDLYFRVNVFPIDLPPLRSRTEDILPLAKYFLERFCRQMGKRVPQISPAVASHLKGHPWPGNVRELQNLIERATIVLDSDTLQVEHLGPASTPSRIARHGGAAPAGEYIIPPSGFSLDEHERSLVIQALERSQNNKTRAARLLGITRATLRYRLEKYGLSDTD